MEVKIKKVYYCDFCKKYRLTSNSIKVHEERCTLNPDRECGVCEKSICKDKIMYDEIIKRIEEAYKVLESHREKEWPNGIVMTFVKEFENVIVQIANEIECPVCMLSIVRQSGKQEYCNYDYKKEMQEYWKRKNEEDDYPY